MNTDSNGIVMSNVQSPPSSDPPAVIPATRRLYWTVRREVWENRSIYLAPLAVAALILAGFLISALRLPGRTHAAAALGPAELHKAIAQPYLIASSVMMLTTLAVGVFYSLDALYGERRDRSVLFWKSLPVSDLVTVLSKVITPVVILPLVTFAITVILQSLMLLASTAVLAASGQAVAPLWTVSSLFETWLMLLYHLLTVHGIWYAPIYAWLLLVSAWSRRAPFLWATLPLLAIGVVERIAFNTSHFAEMVGNRLIGGGGGGDFVAGSLSMDPLMHFAPGEFLTSPGVWIGLALAAAFLAAAVRLRRDRDPI